TIAGLPSAQRGAAQTPPQREGKTARMENRNLFQALAIAFLVLVVSQLIISRFAPPPKPQTAQQGDAAPATNAEATPPGTDSDTGAGGSPAQPSENEGGGAPATMSRADAVVAVGASVNAAPVLGGDGRFLRLTLDSRGAALKTLEVTERDKKGEKYRFAKTTAGDAPYSVLQAISDKQRSYSTGELFIVEGERAVRLDSIDWRVESRDDDSVVFATTIREGDQDLLRVHKRYKLLADSPRFDIELGVENLSSAPLSVAFEQDGPVGIPREHLQYKMRRLMTAQRSGNSVSIGRARQASSLKAAPQPLLVAGSGDFFWTALVNKYFAVITRPLADEGDGAADWVHDVTGRLVSDDESGMLATMATRRREIAPGQTSTVRFEVYAGPKEQDYLTAINPLYTQSAGMAYSLVSSQDSTCFCACTPLMVFMASLLEWIHVVVRNYGVAIIILVVIVRTLLHPLTVWQQKSMFRTQDGMARIQPKMEELKKKHGADKVKLNQEMMKLWSEENVNPAASMLTMLPMMLQMPILIALWTALNTDVHLRHAPFMLWINDLSSPDALVKFAQPVTVPVLGWLPVVGTMFQNIPSFNLLPILMGVSMWLQHRYMPKSPVLEKRLEDAKKNAQPAKAGPMGSLEEQMKMQHTMAIMMAIMLPVMFYYMPSGLVMYWMATNVFGMFESIIVRRQLKEEIARRDREGPRPPRPPGPIGRWMKRMSEQLEAAQGRADALSDRNARNPRQLRRKG
ncbi:MAG: YidC/Oxa1 family insertase periplasmic-domain containing protein, partial [Phycisphaerales bacterium]|nr:YidC/Oxa1 family insertase periplasmic-domain containing protein [Phycisphaerales bacterium]